jgi:MFS transporter, PAT family, beta-lactamase induction signal transducer AmpG
MTKKLFYTGLYAFSSGLPAALLGSTLQAWLKEEGVGLALIGMYALVWLPYTVKFLWAPLVDHFSFGCMDRRRSWMLLGHSAMALCLLTLSQLNPTLTPVLFFSLTLCTAMVGATLDIAIDAYRSEILTPEHFGIGSAAHQVGYRLAMIVSGALGLWMADLYGFQVVYAAMSALYGLGLLALPFAPTPSKAFKPPRDLREAVLEPLREFFLRPHVARMTTFILLYKFDVVFTLALMTAFLLELGFSKTEIATVSKAFGLGASIFGTLLGGLWLRYLSLKRALLIFGLLQGLSSLSFLWLSFTGYSIPFLYLAIGSEQFFSGLGNAAYLSFLMGLCHPKFTGTQFAVLSGIMTLARMLATMPSGYIADTFGWKPYFIVALLLMVPGLWLLRDFDHWKMARTKH